MRAVALNPALSRWRRASRGYLLITPIVFVGLLVIVYPLIYSLRMSFYDYNLQMGPNSMRLIGLGNFVEVLRDPKFLTCIANTFAIAVPAVLLQFLLGLALAIALARVEVGRGLITTLLIMPMMIPASAAALTFGMLYVHRYGPINYLLGVALGQPVNVDWLGSQALVKPSIVLVDTWQMTPFVMLFLLAGLTVISTEVYDAAKVDGASALQRFAYVTLPLLWPAMVAILALRLIDLLKMFDIPYMLTGGGPGLASTTISMYVVDVGFKYLRVGAGAAQSYVLFAMEAVVVGLFLWLSRRMRTVS